jgi:hypothetical protein
MFTINISLSWVAQPPHPNLTAGVHHIAEIMPHVLDRYGLSLEPEQDPDAERSTSSIEAIDLFDVMIACLEETSSS